MRALKKENKDIKKMQANGVIYHSSRADLLRSCGVYHSDIPQLDYNDGQLENQNQIILQSHKMNIQTVQRSSLLFLMHKILKKILTKSSMLFQRHKKDIFY